MNTSQLLAAVFILILGLALASPAEAKIEKVFITPMSHLDIGFTATQAEVAALHKPALDEVVFYLQALEDFAWTIEEFWQLEQWLAETPEGEKREALAGLMRAGRLELGGSFASMHTRVMTGATLARMLYPSLKLARAWDIPVVTVIQNDVPGYTQDLPSILAGNGIRYFLTGINTSLGVGGFDLPPDHNPFYWEGPDGQRVLTWISKDSYTEAYSLTRPKLRSLIQKLEDEGYPYAGVLLISAMDNKDASVALGTLLEVVRVWNEERGETDPEVVMATPREFFQYMEERHAADFPIYTGEWGGLWERNKASAPASTARFRWVQEHLPLVEAFAALLGHDSPEIRAELDKIYNLVLLFAEHTAAAGAGWPGNLTKAQTEISNATVVGWMAEAEERLKNLVPQLLPQGQDRCITVVNTSLVPRSGPVTVLLPEEEWELVMAGKLGLFDHHGRRVPVAPVWPAEERAVNPWRIEAEGMKPAAFWVEGIPPGGWRLYELRPVSDKPVRQRVYTAAAGETLVLENAAFKVEYDAAAGRFVSIVEMGTGREIMDHHAPYPFFAVLRSTHHDDLEGKITQVLQPTPKEVLVVEDELGQTLHVVFGEESEVAEVSVWLPLRGDFMEWKAVLDQGQMEYTPYELHSSLYFAAFPFALDSAGLPLSVFVEGPDSCIAPQDYLPGANRGSLVLRRYLGLEGGGQGLIIASRQAFAATLETPDYGGLEPGGRPYVLFELLRHFDEAGTRDLGPARISQEPGVQRISFEFRIAAGGEFSPEEAAGFAEDFHVPLLAVYGRDLSGRGLPKEGSFLGASGPVELSFLTWAHALPLAESAADTPRYALRLRNTSRAAAQAQITLPWGQGSVQPISEAGAFPGELQHCSGGTLCLEFPPEGALTLLITPYE